MIQVALVLSKTQECMFPAELLQIVMCSTLVKDMRKRNLDNSTQVTAERNQMRTTGTTSCH